MLTDHPVYVDLPATDAGRSRSWYEEKLGLVPTRAFGQMLLYRSGGTPFLVNPVTGPRSRSVAAVWVVDDLGRVMLDLRRRGIEFEANHQASRGPTTVNGVAIIPNGGLAAAFRDSEGNILRIIQLPAGTSLASFPETKPTG